MKNKMLWRWLGLIFVLSFGALGFLGWQIYLSAPPIPQNIVSTRGEVLFTGEQIRRGQQVWLAAGGQQQGSVWGHGAYVAPDWSADWLHREAVILKDLRARAVAGNPAAMTASPLRAKAIREVAGHYAALFGNDQSLARLREQYAMVDDTVPAKADRE